MKKLIVAAMIVFAAVFTYSLGEYKKHDDLEKYHQAKIDSITQVLESMENIHPQRAGTVTRVLQ